MPAPANGGADAAVDEMRLALMAVSCGRPGGQVVDVEELRARVSAVARMDYDSRGIVLPGLVRAQTTRGWLYITGAPLDLRREAATLAHQAAQRREEPVALGIAVWGGAIEMLAAGALEVRDYERVAAIAERVNPRERPSRGAGRRTGWTTAGRWLIYEDIATTLERETTRRRGCRMAWVRLSQPGPRDLPTTHRSGPLDVERFRDVVCIHVPTEREPESVYRGGLNSPDLEQDDYRRHLGVPALVRQDLERLSRLVQQQHETGPARRPGD